jgi:hypothetical protein
MKRKLWAGLVIILIFTMILSACSSSSSSPPATVTLSGVAAAGLPIVGYVYLTDSASPTPHTLGPTPIASDGSFSFDVTSLTAPFYLRAQGSVGGESYDLYSATTSSSGTTNINPLTNLAVAAAAGVNDPSAVYANPASYPITQTSLSQAITNIQTMLAPLLTAYSLATNINPITDTYTANHTGLDKVFDAVSVNIDTDSGSVTVVNALNNTIASGTTTSLSTATAVTSGDATATAATSTDITAIQTMFNNYVTSINKGASLTQTELDSYYATAYGINDGLTRTQTVANDLSQFQGMTNTVTSMNITLKANGNGSDYNVDGVATFSDGSSSFFEGGLVVTYESSSWKLKGNGYESNVRIRSHNERRINADASVQTEGGIQFEIRDKGGNDLQSAIITGPGLPSGGITLSKPKSEPVWLYIDTGSQTSVINPPHLYAMDDTTIGNILDNSVYTIKIYDSGSNLVETRTRTIAKRPFESTELTGVFPTIGGITSHALSTANIGGTLSFTYTLSTVFLTSWLDGYFEFWDNSGDNNAYDKSLMLNQSSGSIVSGTPSWTPTQAAFYLEAQDQYYREVWIAWLFQ